MAEKKVRTRFAPSPTGYMHIGNLRTALYAYLIAKKNDGDFILRIEDTDQERYVEGAVDIIYNTLREAGLKHDEGPDVGGDYGPYIQSERRDIYKKYARQLVDEGKAYYCFCDKERLDSVRQVQEASKMPTKYDGHCRSLSKEEIEEKLASGIPHVIRQKIPTTGVTIFNDEVFDNIKVENATLDDNVLLKSDGLPTYNFANVIDDHLMGITDIVRGSEYLASTPKYNLLYEAFGWDIPRYIHCPPVMKDAHAKLSKRNGDASYEDIIAKGYLKEAVINFIALLGWSPGGENEIFDLQGLIEAFDPKNISKSPAIFDPQKLNWMNGEYIRRLPIEQFTEMAMPFFKQSIHKEIDWQQLATLLQPRTELLTDIPEQVDFVDALPDYDSDLYISKKMKTDKNNSYDALLEILPVLQSITDWTQDEIHTALFELIVKLEVKNGRILWPLRVALSGKQFTPGGGIEMCLLLGKEESIKRLEASTNKLKTELNR